MQSELFTYEIDDKAFKQGELVDGKLLLATNVTDLAPKEIVQRYKSLADIERGFRVLKSEIEIAPMYHRLLQRIRAHAMICFMALTLDRVMRERLKMAKTNLSPERALAQLRRIHHHQIKVNDRSLTGVSTLTKVQTGPRQINGQRYTTPIGSPCKATAIESPGTPRNQRLQRGCH